MEHLICNIDSGSVAEKAGILKGDTLLIINQEEIIDEIDYQALIACEKLCLRIRRNGAEHEILIHRKSYEPLGIHFGDSLTLRARCCRNHCIFCFIEQLPPGMRKTLYVKDDDWRFSLMMGNYITLTNVDENEFSRILHRKPSPIYISVHTTNPDLRCAMLNNGHAGDIMEKLRKLAEAGIQLHCQIVACPGYNDGEELLHTLKDLRSLYPAIQSIAIVPVGLTRYRERLTPLRKYNFTEASKLLNLAEAFSQKCLEEIGTRLVYCSDEFYLMAKQPFPEENQYEDYPQIENGVGMVRKLISELEAAKSANETNDEPAMEPQGQIWIPTGIGFADQLKSLALLYAPKNAIINVVPITNHFFGESITVTGLLTGKDILSQLKPLPIQRSDHVLLCSCCLRNEGDLFLDDMSLQEFCSALPCPVHIISNDGWELYEALHQRFE